MPDIRTVEPKLLPTLGPVTMKSGEVPPNRGGAIDCTPNSTEVALRSYGQFKVF